MTAKVQSIRKYILCRGALPSLFHSFILLIEFKHLSHSWRLPHTVFNELSNCDKWKKAERLIYQFISRFKSNDGFHNDTVVRNKEALIANVRSAELRMIRALLHRCNTAASRQSWIYLLTFYWIHFAPWKVLLPRGIV